jgi:hypothetical protein
MNEKVWELKKELSIVKRITDTENFIVSSQPLQWISLSRNIRRNNRKPKTHFRK